MKRRYSLKGHKSFKEVITNGKKFYGKGIRMIVYREPTVSNNDCSTQQPTRFAVVVNRNYGNAVERNKIKRRIRSTIMTLVPNIRQGFTVIIFPDTTCKTFEYNQLAGSVAHILIRSGVLRQ